MYLNNRTTGASCKNTVDIVANSISLYDPNGLGTYTNIDDIFVKQSQVQTAKPNEAGRYEYPPEEINDYNVSGLKSMIDYINTHKAKPSHSFEETNLFVVKKNVNASKKHFLYEDVQTLNKVNKTVNKIHKTFVFDDNSNITLQKKLTKTTKQLFYEDAIMFNKVNNITNNNSSKYYDMITVQDNHSLIKHTTINNITKKSAPIYINQEFNFFFNKTVAGVSQSTFDFLSERLSQLENSYLMLMNQINPGSA